MFNSETFGFTIGRPLSEVYEFLLEPANLACWAVDGSAAMRHLGGQFRAAETSVGPRIIRFAERNDFGILDHHIFRHAGDTPHPVGARVVANGAGAELIFTMFQRTEMSDSEWGLLKDAVTADLRAMQAMLNARGPVTPLLPSHTVALSIARPVRAVYDYLVEPANFAKWVFVGDARLQSLDAGQWAVETSVGPRVIQFSERNSFGVLDYQSRLEVGGTLLAIPMRVFPNGEGAELTFTFLQRPSTTVEEWLSLREWITADLLALKNMLELEQD